MFSLKAPSLLAFDKERAEGNLHTIYGIARVPCDTHMREILDPVSPKLLRPVFKSIFRQLQRGKPLEAMTFLDGYYLLVLYGTEYFSSKTIHCASCLRKVHRNGSCTYYHQILGAAIAHPDQQAVIPLMPESIVQHDGTGKNDCERNVAKRFVAKLRQDHPHLKFIVTEDSLSSNAPHLETLQAHGLRYILGVKEGDHAFLFEQVQAAEHAGRVTYYERHDRAAGLRHRFRFVNDVLLNASNADVWVNFVEYWESSTDKVQHFSWVTDFHVSTRNVYQLIRGGEHSVILTFLVAAVDTVQTPDPVCRYTWHIREPTSDYCSLHTTRILSALTGHDRCTCWRIRCPHCPRDSPHSATGDR
jgi:hypothetical protein